MHHCQTGLRIRFFSQCSLTHRKLFKVNVCGESMSGEISKILDFEHGLLAVLLPALKKELGGKVTSSLDRVPEDLATLVTQNNIPEDKRNGPWLREVDVYLGEPMDGLATPYLRVYLGSGENFDLRVRTTEGTADAFFDERLRVARILKHLARDYRAEVLEAGRASGATPVLADGPADGSDGGCSRRD
jgi:hypothetical protein